MNYEIFDLVDPQYAWFENDKPTVENFNVFGQDYVKNKPNKQMVSI